MSTTSGGENLPSYFLLSISLFLSLSFPSSSLPSFGLSLPFHLIPPSHRGIYFKHRIISPVELQSVREE